MVLSVEEETSLIPSMYSCFKNVLGTLAELGFSNTTPTNEQQVSPLGWGKYCTVGFIFLGSRVKRVLCLELYRRTCIWEVQYRKFSTAYGAKPERLPHLLGYFVTPLT